MEPTRTIVAICICFFIVGVILTLVYIMNKKYICPKCGQKKSTNKNDICEDCADIEKLEEAASNENILCPHDQTTMKKEIIHDLGIIIDRCTTCNTVVIKPADFDTIINLNNALINKAVFQPS